MRQSVFGKWVVALFGCTTLGFGCSPAERSSDETVGQQRAALISDAAHGNGADFTFLRPISHGSPDVETALSMDDPRRFAAEADPIVRVDEYDGAGALVRRIAEYTTRDPDVKKRVVIDEDDVVLGNTVSAKRKYFKVKIDLKKFEDALQLRIYPFVYRVSVLVDSTVVGFADVALDEVEQVVDGRKVRHKIKHLDRQLECDERKAPAGQCANDFFVTHKLDFDAKFWLGRCAGKSLAPPDACSGPGQCDPLTGSVTFPREPDTKVCAPARCDGPTHLAAAYCQNGVCPAQPATQCGDANVCTDDSCDPGQGCVATHNTATCDDGDPDTSNDTCEAGQCVGVAVDTSCVISKFNTRLFSGGWQGFYLGRANLRRGLIAKINPLENVASGIDRYVVQQEFDGTNWNDVLRVATTPGKPSMNAEVSVMDVSGLPLVRDFTTVLQPGVWHGFSLGRSSDNKAYVPKVSPIDPAVVNGGFIERVVIQPEFNGVEWIDVMRVIAWGGIGGPISANLRVFDATSLPVAMDFDTSLQPGVWHGFPIAPSSLPRAYVVELSPKAAPTGNEWVQNYVVQPEWDGSSWQDVLRAQSPAWATANLSLNVRIRYLPPCP